MFAFHLYLPWVSEIRFTETIGWKAFLKRPLFIAIYLFCSEYCYHSLPQKEGGRRDTSLMFCRQDFFELKSQMRKFSGLFAMDGFRHRLHCKPLLCSLSAFHYTRKHPCLPTRDWPSAHEICTWSWFRARLSGFNLQHKVKCQYTIWGPGMYIPATLEKFCVSPPFAQEFPDMEPTNKTLIFHLF